MTRLRDNQEGYSAFGGGGATTSWIHAIAAFDPSKRDGTGVANRPSGIVLDVVDNDGAVSPYWIWVDSNGIPHLKSSEPTDQDEATSYFGPKRLGTGTLGIDPQQELISGSTVEIATTISGVAAGDIVIIEPATLSGVNFQTAFILFPIARVSAADTIRVRFQNIGPASTPEPVTVKYVWFDLT